MKDKLDQVFSDVCPVLKEWLEKARVNRLPQKVLKCFGGLAVSIILIIMLINGLSYLFNTIYKFIDRHFFGVATLVAGGGYLAYRHDRKKAERMKLIAEEQRGLDSQKKRFLRGCYSRIALFIYSEICTAPNFAELTSCQRPLRPEDMGNKELDSYALNGIMYVRFSLPKMSTELLKTSMVSSVIQGLIDQRIKTGGLQPFIQAGENHYLYVDKCEDMQTYIVLTLVLSFDDTYIQQIAYQNAMNDVIERQNTIRQPEDNDYYG